MSDSPNDEMLSTAAEDNIKAENNVASDTTTASDGQDSGTLNTANSSTAEEAKKPSMLDAVRAALQPKEEQTSSSSDSKDAKDSSAKGDKPDEQDDMGEMTNEEYQSYHSKTRKRIDRFVRKEKALKEEVETLRPAAERLARIESFVAEHKLSKDDMNVMFDAAASVKASGLSNEDFKSGVEIMKAMRNDPQRAYELLAPVFQDLQKLIGEELSPDLRQQVQEGKITEEAAKEISRGRAARLIQTTQAQQQEETSKVQAQQKERETLGLNIGTAITNWEKSWKGSDPDYRTKAALWNDKMDVWIARLEVGKEPMPQTAEEVIKMAEKCKKEVEDSFRKLRPPKPAIQPGPSGASSSTGSKAAPKTMLDVVRTAASGQ